jgi:hypothetical protein
MQVSTKLVAAIRRDAAAQRLDPKIAYRVVVRILTREQDPERPNEWTLPEGCGPVFWDPYIPIGRRIGLFFRRMVRNGELPVRLVRVRSDGHRVYTWVTPKTH